MLLLFCFKIFILLSYTMIVGNIIHIINNSLNNIDYTVYNIHVGFIFNIDS